MSSSVRDKIINHLVSYYLLVDYFDGSFIDSCIATRKKKGTHYGLKLIKKYLNIAKSAGKEVYYLMVRSKIKDEDAL